jgi:hypothetical protein
MHYGLSDEWHLPSLGRQGVHLALPWLMLWYVQKNEISLKGFDIL